MNSTITSKGQTTVPKEVREHFGVAAGDRVKWFILPDGRVVVLPALPVTALKGILAKRGKPVTLEEMEEGIAKGATARYRRYQRQR